MPFGNLQNGKAALHHFSGSVAPQTEIGRCSVFIDWGHLFPPFGLCHVSSVIHMNSTSLLSEHLAAMKRVCVCLRSLWEANVCRRGRWRDFTAEVKLLATQTAFSITLVGKGSFPPSVCFSPHKNKNSSFVRFTVSMTL